MGEEHGMGVCSIGSERRTGMSGGGDGGGGEGGASGAYLGSRTGGV